MACVQLAVVEIDGDLPENKAPVASPEVSPVSCHISCMHAPHCSAHITMQRCSVANVLAASDAPTLNVVE